MFNKLKAITFIVRTIINSEDINQWIKENYFPDFKKYIFVTKSWLQR